MGNTHGSRSASRSVRGSLLPWLDRGGLKTPQLLMAWMGLWIVLRCRQPGWSWHYFATGSRILFSRQALDLYATHSELQIGPLALVAAAPFTLVLHGLVGKAAAILVMSAAGLFVLSEIRRLAPPGPRGDPLVLVI